jgi:hypothetical protein
MTSTLTIPSIHLNGTSRDALVEGYCDAIDALHDAGRKLAASYPNGRDYYIQGQEAVQLAMAEHETRMRKLKEIISEIEQIVEAIS